jgi:hypothetical protein
VAALALVPAQADATFPGQNGKIAFTRLDDSELRDLLTIDPVTSQEEGPYATSTDPFVAAWSPDGRYLAYDEAGVLRKRDMTTGQTSVLTSNAYLPAWSADGTQIAYVRGAELRAINAVGTGDHLVLGGPNPKSDPAWSPDGMKIAFSNGIGGSPEIDTVRPDGTGLTPIGNGFGSNWSPDGSKLAFVRIEGDYEIYVMNVDGSGVTKLTDNSIYDDGPAWSPTGKKLAFTRLGTGGITTLYTMNPDGTSPAPVTTQDASDPDWQPIPYTGYPRPRGATTLSVPLVPAYKSCTAPNRTHGAPLASPSCNPPSQNSLWLTVGTPDANGAGAKSIGSYRFDAIPGDIRFSLSLTDVRCTPAPSATVCNSANSAGGRDYSGRLLASAIMRVSDHYNGPSQTEAATMQDIPLPVDATCANSVSISEGGLCAINTTANAVYPGIIQTGKRAIWGVGQVQVFDGGVDGNPHTGDGETIAFVQGVFVP